MAKVDELKFSINNENFKIPINIGVSGLFRANLPQEVARKLNLKSEMSADTLSALRYEFFGVLERYKTAATSQFLYLAIRYGSCGVYNRKENGDALFFHMNSSYKVDNWSDDIDKIAFEYRVVIMESVDGVEKWYTTHKSIEGVFEKHNTFYNSGNKWKTIPYDETCHQTLIKAEEGLRKISETLFNFMEQDTDKIIASLSNNQLLLS